LKLVRSFYYAHYMNIDSVRLKGTLQSALH
jgi:hypothetical protein